MPTYEYLCQKCETITEKVMHMSDEQPKTVRCPKCRAEAFRFFGSIKVKIPENFQAASEMYNSDDGANLDYLKGRMKHGTRPSGRTSKIYY